MDNVRYKYMLDANICIYAINNQPKTVADKVVMVGEYACCISSIVASELAYGAEKSGRTTNKVKLQNFLSLFDIVDFNADCMWHYARLRNELQQTGQVIGSLDMLIASHALALDTILVTNNNKEFKRINGLIVDNWV